MYMNKKRIYLDHAAATPVDNRVFEAMKPFFGVRFGNSGSMHKEGVLAKEAVFAARSDIAKILGAHPDEIIFTSGGTEANNLAILGAVKAVQKQGAALKDIHIITSFIEHSSVKDVFMELEREGVAVSYAGVDKNAVVNLKDIKKFLCANTILISIMYANNEIGTIQPLHDIAKIIKNYKKEADGQRLAANGIKPATVIFHSDASQTPSYLPINVSKLGVDILTLDGQKIYGPKGIGVLYKKRDILIQPLLFGGHQEFNLRPGTANVPGIIGFAEALKLVVAEHEHVVERLTKLRDYFIKKVLGSIKGAELNGDVKKRIANNINISFPGVPSEWIILQLDAHGIAVGSKSACLSAEDGGSYVIAALGKSKTYTESSVRFTLGKDTAKKDIDYTIDTLIKIIRTFKHNLVL